jgi:large subunit ribosomal protein L18
MLRNNEKVTKQRRTTRTRSKIFGTLEIPRLVVFRSNKYLYAQLVDDSKGVTLGTIDADAKKAHKKIKKIEASFELGKKMAEIAKSAGIGSVVFDKGPYKYHGRVKSFAEGAREGGLVF